MQETPRAWGQLRMSRTNRHGQVRRPQRRINGSLFRIFHGWQDSRTRGEAKSDLCRSRCRRFGCGGCDRRLAREELSGAHRQSTIRVLCANSATAPSVAAQASQTPLSAGLRARTILEQRRWTSQNAQPLTEAHKGGVPAAQSAAPATAGADATRSARDTDRDPSSEPRFVEPSANSEENGEGHAVRRKLNDAKNAENRPRQDCVANSAGNSRLGGRVDVDPVVKLDALIDEKGNLVEAKPISGPRALQASAQRAVAIVGF